MAGGIKEAMVKMMTRSVLFLSFAHTFPSSFLSRHLLRHELTSLDVHNCVNLSRRSLEAINRHSMSLLSLNVGNSVQILPDCIMPADDALEDSLDEVDDGIEDATQRSSRQSRSTTVYDERGYIIWAPNLRR